MSGTVGLERPSAMGAALSGVFCGVGAAGSLEPEMFRFEDILCFFFRVRGGRPGDEIDTGREFQTAAIKMCDGFHGRPCRALIIWLPTARERWSEQSEKFSRVTA